MPHLFQKRVRGKITASASMQKRSPFGIRKTGIPPKKEAIPFQQGSIVPRTPLRDELLEGLRKEIRETRESPIPRREAKQRRRGKERALRALKTAGKIALGTGIVAAGLTYGPKTVSENALTKKVLWGRFVQNNPQLRMLAEIADPHYKRMFEEQRRNPIFWNPKNWDLSKSEWMRIDAWKRKMVFQNMLEHYAKEYGANPEFTVGVASFESELNPWARNRQDLGLGQLGPLVRKDLVKLKKSGYVLRNGRKIDFAPTKENDYFDPNKNARATAEWIAYLSDQLNGDKKSIAMAYKDGIAGAKKGNAERYWEWIKQRMEKRRLEKVMTEQGVPSWAIHTLTTSVSAEEAEKYIRAEHARNLQEWKQEEAKKAARAQHQQKTKNALKMFGRKN